MNIKKIAPALLALSLLTACGGDSGETVQTGTQTSVSVVQTTASAASTAAETTAAATTDAATAATSAATTAAETAAASTAASTAAATTNAEKPANTSVDKTKLAALSERIANIGDGSVKMSIIENIDKTKVAIVSYTAGKKTRMETDMMGFKMVILNDGQNTYTLAPDDKVYAKGESKDNGSNGMESVFDAVNDSSKLKLINSGTEEYKGKKCDFEEYEGTDKEGKKETYKFYFDSEGNVIGLGLSDKTMQSMAAAAADISIDFSVTLEDKVDDSMFTLPSDYEEITQEKMGMKMLEKIFGGLGDMLGEAAEKGAQAG